MYYKVSTGINSYLHINVSVSHVPFTKYLLRYNCGHYLVMRNNFPCITFLL